MAFSLDDRHIVITYHYIRDPDPAFSGIHSCPVKEFEKQLSFLKENFEVTTIPEVFRAAREADPLKMCAITFDDGLKDNYKNAIPVLQKYRTTATFFPITSTFSGVFPVTHKIHILLSRLEVKELIDLYNTYIKKFFSSNTDEYYIPKDRRLTTLRKVWDDILTANFKEMMNILPVKIRNDFLTHMFFELKLDEKELVDDFFMSSYQVRELAGDGFYIGSHGHTHDAFDRLPSEGVAHEIIESKKILTDITQKPVTLLSYPQGGSNRDVIRYLQQEGFTHAVTTEKRGINNKDSEFSIPRYDTNNIRDFFNNEEGRHF